ncbi:MAG TPA: twin-arginine translocation pathway signal protein [Paracoccaceae bacterium]|nr:twin-arginine translocation pathway signal protein [Paracoccaceae bacterium]
MTITRRKLLAVIGGGTILAAGAGIGAVATRSPRTATLPWAAAGAETEPRRRALSFALLAPNPHNRQPWLVDLSRDGEVTLFADLDRLLPHTDPVNRQIAVGLGGFLELMRMAAAETGHRVAVTPFPEGEDAAGLDARPVARAVFAADPAVPRDPLFAQVMARRSTKEPYDTSRPVPPQALAPVAAAATATRYGQTVDTAEIAALRDLTREALEIELATPRTYRESVDLFRIGAREVDANPDGIDFTGPMFEALGSFGLFSREAALDRQGSAFKAGVDAVMANATTAMGFVWLTTSGNTRSEQLAAGADWLRVKLALTAAGIATQPMSQALQEFPEMAGPYAQAHRMLAPEGGVVQMLGRVGYGPRVGPSPRWPLETRLLNA